MQLRIRLLHRKSTLHSQRGNWLFLPMATPKNMLEMLLNPLSQTLGGSFRGRQCRSDTSSDNTRTSTEPSVHMTMTITEKNPSHGKCLQKPGCQSSLEDASSASSRDGGTSRISSMGTVFFSAMLRLLTGSIWRPLLEYVDVCSGDGLSRW